MGRAIADLRVLKQSTKIAIDGGGVIAYRAGFGSGDMDEWAQVMSGLADTRTAPVSAPAAAPTQPAQVAAAAPTATPTAASQPTPTPVPQPTDTPVPAPTDTPTATAVAFDTKYDPAGPDRNCPDFAT